MFYETVDDITADAGIRVEGSTREEIICRSVLATFNEITDIDRVKPSLKREVSQEGKFPFLLADIINRALHLHETEGFVASSCSVDEVSEEKVTLSLLGEIYDPARHTSKLVIKAATYHRLRFERRGEKWIAQVIFDI